MGYSSRGSSSRGCSSWDCPSRGSSSWDCSSPDCSTRGSSSRDCSSRDFSSLQEHSGSSRRSTAARNGGARRLVVEHSGSSWRSTAARRGAPRGCPKPSTSCREGVPQSLQQLPRGFPPVPRRAAARGAPVPPTAAARGCPSPSSRFRERVPQSCQQLLAWQDLLPEPCGGSSWWDRPGGRPMQSVAELGRPMRGKGWRMPAQR